MESHSKNHYFVNWVDGMKINKSHFQETDNATIDLIAKTAAVIVNSNRYGLLAVGDFKHKPEDIVLSLDGQQTLKAQLNNCLAVSSGGHYIHITDAFKGVVYTAIGKLDDNVLNGLVVIFRIHHIGSTQLLRKLKFTFVNINANNAFCTRHTRAYNC